jgi:glycosyltransferase involved in cell wall biosynthesis
VPTVAVIVPAYNPDETWLRSALESVIGQTFADWEAVVVDDGSIQPLGWCGDLDERISVVRQANLGLPGARNRGLLETTAPFVAFLDADDEWLPTKLDRQVSLLEEDADQVMCSTDFEHIDESGARIGPGYSGHDRTYIELLTGCGIVPSTVMVRRTALNRVGPFMPLASAEDWELWLRLAMVTDLGVVDEVLARYRLHSSNMTLNYLRILRAGTVVLEMHRERALAAGEAAIVSAADEGLRALRRRSGRQAFDAARQSLHRKDHAGFARHLSWAIRLAPVETLADVSPVRILRHR